MNQIRVVFNEEEVREVFENSIIFPTRTELKEIFINKASELYPDLYVIDSFFTIESYSITVVMNDIPISDEALTKLVIDNLNKSAPTVNEYINNNLDKFIKKPKE